MYNIQRYEINTCEFFQLIGFYDLLAGTTARTEVIPSAIAHLAHLHNLFNQVFAVLIFMP